METKKPLKKAYFIFFYPMGSPAHPIAIYFDKAKAVKHARESTSGYIQLRMCDWDEGIIPTASETSQIVVEPIKPRKKKEVVKNDN
jgi:hypothetical protein